MEKYYNAKIEQQQKTDTELLSFLEAAKTFLAFAARVVSLFFGYIGVRNLLFRSQVASRKSQREPDASRQSPENERK